MVSPVLAAVGEVGEGFFEERNSDTLPCQADAGNMFCFDWAREDIDRLALQPFSTSNWS